MQEKCNDAVNYSILVNKNEVQIAIEEDDVLPRPDSINDEVSYFVKDSAIGYHSFIHIIMIVENSKKSGRFTIVICPFGIINNEVYRYAIQDLIQLTYDSDTERFGQNDAEIGIVDRIAAEILVDENLDVHKRKEKLYTSKGVFYTIKYSFPSVGEIFQLIKQTSPRDIAPYKSRYCQFCRQFG
ncbi:MAG: hypothetical protein WA941_01305 [Nitrososphaeraceae archaeon]